MPNYDENFVSIFDIDFYCDVPNFVADFYSEMLVCHQFESIFAVFESSWWRTCVWPWFQLSAGIQQLISAMIRGVFGNTFLMCLIYAVFFIAELSLNQDLKYVKLF